MSDSEAPQAEVAATSEAPAEKPTAKFFYRFLFPSALTGLVVGKGGTIVKSLRERYHVDIFIKETKGPERMMRFKGESAVDIASCMEEVATKWAEHTRKMVPNLKENQSEVRLIVHRSQCGVIIGKRGEGIKELRKKHNCMILMHGECLPRSQERCCQIAGEPEKIREALIEILEDINRVQVEFDSKEWYNADNADDTQDYGGFKSQGYNPNSAPGGHHPPPGHHAPPHYAPNHPVPNPPLPGWQPPPGQPMPVTYHYQPGVYGAPPPVAAYPYGAPPPPQPVYGHPPPQAPYGHPPPQPAYSPHPPPAFGGYQAAPAGYAQHHPGAFATQPRFDRAGGPQRNDRGGMRDSKPDYFRR